MLYIVSLMPLVDRGRYLRCLLSYVFLCDLIPSPPDIGSFLEIKVGAQLVSYDNSADWDISSACSDVAELII